MSYTIRIKNSPISFDCDDDDTILDAGLNAGLNLPHACRGGSCGCCLAKVESGDVEYLFEPIALTEDEVAENKVLLCACVPASDVEVSFDNVSLDELAESTIQIQELPVKINYLEKLTADLMLMKLAVPKTKNFEFKAGQYIDFILRDGRRRSFSIANRCDLSEKEIELHIRLIENGHFTTRVFNSMKKGDILRIAGPYGNFTLQQNSRPIIFMAGGTGIAPIKSIIDETIHEDYRTPVTIIWGTRTFKDLYIHQYLTELESNNPHINYIPVLSRPDEDWKGQTGHIHKTLESLNFDLNQYDIYASGRPDVIESIKSYLVSVQFSSDKFYFDSFEFAAN